MSKEIRAHQIEELLLNAHLEQEGGIDLIDEYFRTYRSLDHITAYAKDLLSQNLDKQTHAAVIKNLSECIVVKNQQDNRSFRALASKWLKKVGFSLGKNPEIVRAEQLIQKIAKR